MPIIIDTLEVDGALRETHPSAADVTSHPVETGAATTDHVIVRPRRYAMTGVVSNTPFGPLAARRVNDGFALGGQLDGVLPTQYAHDFLKALLASRQPVTVQSNLEVYENMVLDIYIPQEDRNTGNSLQFRAEFQQLTLVTNLNETVEVTIPRAQRKRNRGSKTSPKPSETNPPTTDARLLRQVPAQKNQSALKKTLQGDVGGALRRVTGNFGGP